MGSAARQSWTNQHMEVLVIPAHRSTPDHWGPSPRKQISDLRACALLEHQCRRRQPNWLSVDGTMMSMTQGKRLTSTLADEIRHQIARPVKPHPSTQRWLYT